MGSGNETTFFGDHDLWRLPQADDSDTTSGNQYAAAHRPVFEAAAPGAKIDPDIVGRVAAAFAFAAQADAAGNPARAATELGNATSLYAMANTSPSPLGSVLPTSYYHAGVFATARSGHAETMADDRLDEYKRKRDFAVTAEPVGGDATRPPTGRSSWCRFTTRAHFSSTSVWRSRAC